MRNFRLTLEYDGTNFNGWQVQSQGERTIQGELEKTLYQIFKMKVKVNGSGRTDAGVHALGQVANFKAKTKMLTQEVRKALNALLPRDVVIVDVVQVDSKFHAQYSAKLKTYRYTILNQLNHSALQRNYSHFIPYHLNVSRMRFEARGLVGKKDFKSFEAADPDRPKHSSVRTIKNITIKKRGPLVTIDVQADGFLYKMVRNIVGTLMEAGAGKLSKGSVGKILKQKDRNMAGQTALAQGLCLLEVKY